MQSSQAALPFERSGLCSGFGALAFSSKARGSSMSRRRGGPGRGGATGPLPGPGRRSRRAGAGSGRAVPRGGASRGAGSVRGAQRSPRAAPHAASPGPSCPLGSVCPVTGFTDADSAGVNSQPGLPSRALRTQRFLRSHLVPN